jgi:hypothetical protein
MERFKAGEPAASAAGFALCAPDDARRVETGLNNNERSSDKTQCYSHSGGLSMELG